MLLCYQLPFEAESTQLLYVKIRQGLVTLPHHLNPLAADLLRGMLEVQPERRLTLAQVVLHEWAMLHEHLSASRAPVSQTVDAVVDTQRIDGTDLLSATNLFATGAGPGPEKLRRSYTYDALPRSGSGPALTGSVHLGGGGRAPRAASGRGMPRRGMPIPPIPPRRAPPLAEEQHGGTAPPSAAAPAGATALPPTRSVCMREESFRVAREFHTAEFAASDDD